MVEQQTSMDILYGQDNLEVDRGKGESHATISSFNADVYFGQDPNLSCKKRRR